MAAGEKLDLTVILPCLNEERNIGYCIKEAEAFIKRRKLNAEILVVDNGSSDRTAETARRYGVTVIHEARRGYGRAIRTGLEHSRGGVIVIADGDSTYDLYRLDRFYYPLRCGYADVVIGDRFSGRRIKGAMPVLHRAGAAVLSGLARARFGTGVRDFHCGLRALTSEAAERLTLHTDGMEFATEMIAEAAKNGLRIAQTPVTLRRARYGRVSKLRTFSDGTRHLKYIISPAITGKNGGKRS